MAIYNFTKASLQPSLAGGCCWCLTLSSWVQWGTPWSVTWWLSECVRGFTLNIQLRARRQWPLSCSSLYGFQCQPGSLVPVHFHFHHTTDCVHCRCVSQLLGVPLFLVFVDINLQLTEQGYTPYILSESKRRPRQFRGALSQLRKEIMPLFQDCGHEMWPELPQCSHYAILIWL